VISLEICGINIFKVKVNANYAPIRVYQSEEKSVKSPAKTGTILNHKEFLLTSSFLSPL
jgi:hypothetical protein